MALAADLPESLLCRPSRSCCRTRPRWWPRSRVPIGPHSSPSEVFLGSLLSSWPPGALRLLPLGPSPCQRPGSSHSGLSQASSCFLHRPGPQRLSREDKSEAAPVLRHRAPGEAAVGPWDCFLSFGRL